MKVTPIAGPNMGSTAVSGAASAPDRKEAAKQAFLGNTGTTITKEEKPEDVAALAEALNVRKIKMRTNVTPGHEAQEAMTDAESAIQDPNEAVESEVTRPISPQFAALAKQRRALELRAKEIELKEKALTEKSTAPAFDIARLKANPLAVLKEADVSYDQLTEAILAEQSGVSPEVRELQAKIEALEKGFDSKLSERDTQAEKQVLSEIQREADRLVATGEDFEMVRGTNSQKKVTELIHRIWKTSGEVLDVEEAARLVEDQLVEDSLKMANFGKVRSKLTPAQEEQSQTPAQKPYGLRTLTNRDTAQRPASAKARAIAAFNGTLKR